MRFTKMHGTGNDYIYVNLIPGTKDCVSYEADQDGNLVTIEGKPVADVAIKVSDRHFGIGSDGLIAIAPSDVADVRMIMYNADGSEGAMCGNGIRCVAKYACDHGLLGEKVKYGSSAEEFEEIDVETASGVKHLKLTITDGKCTYVEVNMGQAILLPEEIPVDVELVGYADSVSSDIPSDYIVNRVLIVDGAEYRVTCVSMGNPHCVVFTSGIDDLDLEKIGPKFENHLAFPDRINTEFVEVIDDHTLRMRVWERGSGETISCGTGTCAVTVASVLNGYTKRDEEIEIRIRGGKLFDTYLGNGNVMMKGPATEVFSGEYGLE
ncbi:MAG: diaminopimelate epimerase [Eubacterium sp.]|nr:diaminopimelate epimerase [Eubacterium sp.]